jgi:hypothetical protein
MTARSSFMSATRPSLRWESEAFDLNVVGRVGFLDHLRVALVDYEQTFYASLYEQE